MKEFDEQVLKMAQILDSRKGEDILMIDVRESTILADWFVVATGRSTTHVRTLAEELEEKLAKEENLHKLGAEGAKEARWIVLDYGNVIVHIFQRIGHKIFLTLAAAWKIQPKTGNALLGQAFCDISKRPAFFLTALETMSEND